MSSDDSIPFIEIDVEPSDSAGRPSRSLTMPHASVDWMAGFDEGRQRGSGEILDALEAALVAVGVGADVARSASSRACAPSPTSPKSGSGGRAGGPISTRRCAREIPSDHRSRPARGRQARRIRSKRRARRDAAAARGDDPRAGRGHHGGHGGRRGGPVGETSAALLGTLAEFYKVPVPPVRVLGVRPHKVTSGVCTYQLFGDYTPSTQRIRVWMRTAIRGQVSSPKAHINTLLHEFCHHLDCTRLHCPESYHTRGFFWRIDHLYHLAVGTPPERRRPLRWVRRGGVWIDRLGQLARPTAGLTPVMNYLAGSVALQ